MNCGTCGTCKYWDNPYLGSEDRKYCCLISPNDVTIVKSTIAFAEDSGGTDAYLRTDFKFGCIQWEAS